MATIKDALEILNRMDGDDPELRQMVEESRFKAHIGALIYDARTEAGLTQAQLAKKARIFRSAIADLEDSAFEGDAVSMLIRIGDVLGKRLHPIQWETLKSTGRGERKKLAI